MGHSSNAQKSSPATIRDNASVLLGEALAKLRKRIKKKDFADKCLVELVGKLIPIVIDTDTQSATDVTLDLLAEKAVKVNLRIMQANENQQSQQSDTEDENTATTKEENEHKRLVADAKKLSLQYIARKSQSKQLAQPDTTHADTMNTEKP